MAITADARDERRISTLRASIPARQKDAVIAAIVHGAGVYEKKVDKKTVTVLAVIAEQMVEMLYSDRHRELLKNVLGIDPKKWYEEHKGEVKKSGTGGWCRTIERVR